MPPRGEKRANYYHKARAIAFKELPSVLEPIRAEAKVVIHS
jgi:hypothetical protein